jgi:uncharacterized lipoprotein yehR
MKKVMKLFAVLFTALFVLLGCAKEESTAFELKNDQQTSTITYYYKGDVVTKQVAENKYVISELPMSEEKAMEQIKQMNELYTSIKGVTASLESKDGIITQVVTFDYSVVKFEDLKKALPDNFSGDGKAVSFKASKEAMEKIGYKEKK